MVCRRCGYNFDPRRYDRGDGAAHCPQCGAIYRKRPQNHQTNQQPQRRPRPSVGASDSAGDFNAKLSKILNKRLLKIRVGIWPFLLAATIAVIVIIGAIFGNDAPTPDPTERSANEQASETLAPDSFDSPFDYAAAKTLREGYEVTGVENSVPSVTFDAQGFNADTMVRSFNSRVCDYCKALTQAPDYAEATYYTVVFFGTCPAYDVYGNESIETALSVTLTKETIDKVNWENFLSDNLESIAERYYVDDDLYV